MLKVKSLNMTAGLSREEALADGVAVVKVTGVADPIAKGVCRFKADGTNTVALIHAAGNPSAITTPFAPSAITVEVEKVLNREVAVKKGDTSINTGLGDAVTAAKLDGTDVTGDLSHGVITIDAAAQDEVHEQHAVNRLGNRSTDEHQKREESGLTLSVSLLPHRDSRHTGRSATKGRAHSRNAKRSCSTHFSESHHCIRFHYIILIK